MMTSNDLNDQQQKIVKNGDGVVIIKAGPGTGKTKTLTSRVAFLVKDRKVDPQKILTLTFTNRAAGEMRERLGKMVTTLPLVTTFHGFAFDLLTEWGQEKNLVTEEERDEIIRKTRKETKSKLSSKDLSLQISLHKNSPDNITSGDMKDLINLYQAELKRRDLLDFDDLILNVFYQIKENKKLRKLLKDRFDYILIDEFQDTNDLQYQFIKLILRDPPNLFVIGDPLQSIYGFRGANSRIFKTLKKDFSQTKEETLEVNYRSYKNIVYLSNSIFSNIANVSPFSLEDGSVGLIETLNEYSEAEWIISFINEKIGGADLLKAKSDVLEREITFADFAVIYRTHHLAQALEKKLENSGFPYQIVKEDTPVEGDHIKLLSMHAAKGLEFKYVFICGFEEGLIPYRSVILNQVKNLEILRPEPLRRAQDDNLEEEKRLLYVAMTRAKEELYLIYTKKRNGQKSEISIFNTLLNSQKLFKEKDEAIEKFAKRMQANKIKKSQMNLF